MSNRSLGSGPYEERRKPRIAFLILASFFLAERLDFAFGESFPDSSRLSSG